MKAIRIYSKEDGLLNAILSELKTGLSEGVRIEYCTYLNWCEYMSGNHSEPIERTVNITSDRVWVTPNHDMNPDDEYDVFLFNSMAINLPGDVVNAMNKDCVKKVGISMDFGFIDDEKTPEVINRVIESCNDSSKVIPRVYKVACNTPYFLEIYGIKPAEDGSKEVTIEDCYLRGDYVRKVSDQGKTTIEPTIEESADYVRYFSLLSEGRRRALVEPDKEEEFKKQVPITVSNLDVRDITETFKWLLIGSFNAVQVHDFNVPITTEKITFAKLARRHGA